MDGKVSKADQDAARDALRGFFPRESTVSTLVLHVSESGMSRAIAVLGVYDGAPENVSGLVARALGERLHPKHMGVNVRGCGMDMGFDLTYRLASVLYGDGYALHQRRL